MKLTLKQIIESASDYETGELGLRSCVERYCEDHGIPQEIGDSACEWFEEKSAIEAGIPASVARNQARLGRHFSREYIEFKSGRSSIL